MLEPLPLLLHPKSRCCSLPTNWPSTTILMVLCFRQTMDRHFTLLEHAPKISHTIGFTSLDLLKMQKKFHLPLIWHRTPKMLSLFVVRYTLWLMIGKPSSRNSKTR